MAAQTVVLMASCVAGHFGYKLDDIVTLTDDPRNHPRQIPTRANIVWRPSYLIPIIHSCLADFCYAMASTGCTTQ